MFRDYYKLPLKKDGASCIVWDTDNNFVLELETAETDPKGKLIDVINGTANLASKESFRYDSSSGYIINQNDDIIMCIIGWSRLVGIEGYYLSDEEASEVQDSFADYIVQRLNYREEVIKDPPLESIKDLLIQYRDIELPEWNTAFHHDAEGWSVLKHFEKWLLDKE